MKDYERVTFNMKSDLLEKVDVYCSAGYGRSALLNYLIASALSDDTVIKLFDELLEKRRESN